MTRTPGERIALLRYLRDREPNDPYRLHTLQLGELTEPRRGRKERKMSRITNAKIIKAELRVHEHYGFLELDLYIKWDGGESWFGGRRLDEHSEAWGRNIGTAYGLDYLMEVMRTIGVRDFNKIVGSLVRVKIPDEASPPSAIGHIMNDCWLDPEIHANVWASAEATQ